MIRRPYPAYRPSGVEWLGDVPVEWEVRRLGHYFRERREKVSDTDYAPLSVTKNGVVPQLETAAKTDDNDNRKLVRAGDFVINGRSDRKGSSGLAEADGSVSLINIVLEPQGIDGRFTHQLLRSYPFQEEFYRYGKGIVADLWSTNYSDMRNISLAVPPLVEQEQIARFLGHETSKLDNLIAKQERLVELLQEKRQAIISHAVTKGLDPLATLKDSGVDWLGQVPAHWQVKQLGILLERITYGFTNPMPETDDGPFMLTANDIGDGEIKYATARRTSLSAFESSITDKSRPRAGDLLLTKDGTLGRVAIAGEAAICINQSVALLRPRQAELKSAFGAFALRGGVYQDRMVLDAGGTTIKHIYITRLAKMAFAVPPVQEQEELSSYLTDRLYRLNVLVGKAKRSIALMREHRVSLISAAVTGKIDVRGYGGVQRDALSEAA